jgi:hypothetical protein
VWGRQPPGGYQEHHRAGRGGDQGVQIQDLPELGTVDGVADIGFALAAWFIDPHDNWIGLLQLKDPGVRPHGAATGAA